MLLSRLLTNTSGSTDADMTDNAQAVLRLLVDGLRLRSISGTARLKRADYILNCPGGVATIHELFALGYVDDRDNLTEAGRAIAKSLTAALRSDRAKKAAAASAKARAKARAKRKDS